MVGALDVFLKAPAALFTEPRPPVPAMIVKSPQILFTIPHKKNAFPFKIAQDEISRSLDFTFSAGTQPAVAENFIPFRLINTFLGEIAGRQVLSSAFAARFLYRIHWLFGYRLFFNAFHLHHPKHEHNIYHV